MRLFDCTLRDGANVVGNGFSKELTIRMVKALLECGIDQIEIGNAKGLGAYDSNAASSVLTDLEYMQAVAAYTSQGNIGMFLQANYATKELIEMAAENEMHFLRIGAAAGDGKSAVSAITEVKKAGLFCRYSMMKAYVSSAEELAEEGKMLEDSGVDIITIMDSAGTMFPHEVAQYVSALKKKVSIPIGFHGHSNMGLAQANALAAADAGAYEIDCGLLGMARSAGNCATELVTAAFQRQKQLLNIDLYKLLHYLDGELIPAMQEYGYHVAVKPIDLILGLSGCHSSFLSLFESIAKEENVSFYQLIVEVSKIDKKNPSEYLIRKTSALICK